MQKKEAHLYTMPHDAVEPQTTIAGRIARETQPLPFLES
jgi:hypothetical protein